MTYKNKFTYPLRYLKNYALGVYAGLHEHHKEDYKKKLSAIDDYSENMSGDASDVFDPLEPQTDAEKKSLDDINKLAGHKKDE
jgi:hypothetical protein